MSTGARSSTHTGCSIGIDVGGTFTDAVLADGRGLWRAKASTTPDDVGRGVIDACRAVAARANLSVEAMLQRTHRFGLGTSVVTNLLATRSGRRVGLITTRGFEELVPIGRGALESQGGFLGPIPQLVEREHIVGIDERIDRAGTVVRPLDPNEVVAAATWLLEGHKVEALAVSFLWSFLEPAHEQLAVATIKAAFPGVLVTSGADMHPAIREYERTAAALLNASAAGSLDAIATVTEALRTLGLTAPVLLVHSNGGTVSIPEAQRAPIALVGSGPAAGVLAAASILPRGDLVACDMGGTSLDIAVASDGVPNRTLRGPLMGYWVSLSRLEIESIGAGGGSIAWADERGMLRVGPASAGATPGPACYGAGGTDPTVTDALVVLGHIDPDRFLGGDRPIDASAALAACATLGVTLDLDATEVAWGIRALTLINMARAVRHQLASRGLDPRTHTLVSYGGCGGLFACDLAREVGIPRVLVPRAASVLCAYGAATADVRRERVRSLVTLLPIDARHLRAVAEDLHALVHADLAADGVELDDRDVWIEADLRFKRQTFELTVPVVEIDDRVSTTIGEGFRRAYAARYGAPAMMRDAPIELVTLRSVGLGHSTGTAAPPAPPAPTASPHGPRSRRIQVGRTRSETAIVDVVLGDVVRAGGTVSGPAVVDEGDTRIWLPPDSTARVDADGHLVVELVD